MEERPVAGSRWLPRAAVAVVFAVFGLLLATGFDVADDTRGARSAELGDVVDQRQREVAGLDEEAAALRSELDAAAEQTAGTDAAVQAERAAGDEWAPAAAITPLRGPALAVELTDAPAPPPGEPLPVGVTYDDLVVHQQDVQSVVNALWAGGAEGIAVMDQRITATSAVRCVGNTLILEGQVYAPPYRVTAIGDITRLRASLEADPAVTVYREWAQVVGLGFTVRDDEEVELPGYDGPLQLRYAKAAA
jgi:uncharacterized protein YlxW (UPF0749 family)